MKKKNNQIEAAVPNIESAVPNIPPFGPNANTNANVNANANVATLSSTFAQVLKNFILILRSSFRFLILNSSALYFKVKYYLIENKYFSKYTYKIFPSAKIIFYAFVYMFSATGVLMFGNIYIRYGSKPNIIILLYDNFKLSLYELYQNILVNLRDIIDSYIDYKFKQDNPNIPNIPSDNKIPSNNEALNNNNYYKKWLEELSRGDYKNNDVKEQFYSSPYFYIPLIIITGIIIYYSYDYLLEYIKHIKPNDNVNLNSPFGPNDNINININTSDQPNVSSQTSPVSDKSNLTVRGTNAPSTSPIESNTSRVWADASNSSTSNNTPPSTSVPKGTNKKIYSTYTPAPRNEGFIYDTLEEEFDFYFR